MEMTPRIFIQMVAGNHGGRYVQGLSKRELKNLLEEYQTMARETLDKILIIKGESYKGWCFSCKKQAYISMNFDMYQFHIKWICKGNPDHDVRLEDD